MQISGLPPDQFDAAVDALLILPAHALDEPRGFGANEEALGSLLCHHRVTDWKHIAVEAHVARG